MPFSRAFPGEAERFHPAMNGSGSLRRATNTHLDQAAPTTPHHFNDGSRP
jgi:hypothetical protein